MRGKKRRIYGQRGVELRLGTNDFALFQERLTQVDVGDRFTRVMGEGLREQGPSARQIASLAHQ